MKASGIIRRTDDLGRVTIPKEVRKQLNIEEGEPLELFIDENNNIILKCIDRYRLQIWAISYLEEVTRKLCIDWIEGRLDTILLRLKEDYRFTESETANILNLFEKNESDDFNTELYLYGLEFFIERI